MSARAIPDPRPTSALDPLAPTAQEWRELERNKEALRRSAVKWVARALTLPLLLGGPWAFPLVYAWKLLLTRWPSYRLLSALWLLPVCLALRLFPERIFAPWGQLVGAIVGAERDLPVGVPVWPALTWSQTLPPRVKGLRLEPAVWWFANPLPPLWQLTLLAWPMGLVLAGILTSAWGVGALREGARLKSRTVREVLAAARRLRKRGLPVIVDGVLTRGHVGLLYSPEGGGKSEWFFAMVAASINGRDFCGLKTRKAKWYLLTEQTDTTLEPYLVRWGLEEAVAQGLLRIVTQEDAQALWERHGHMERPPWRDFGPIALRDAGEWGADVVVADTSTFWLGSAMGATGLGEALTIIKQGVKEYAYAFLFFSHTNAKGDLLGNKELRRLCDTAIKMDMPWGKYHPTRTFTYDKDRSATAPAPVWACQRDLSSAPPCYVRVPVPHEDDPPTPVGPTPSPSGGPQGPTPPWSPRHPEDEDDDGEEAPPSNVLRFPGVRIQSPAEPPAEDTPEPEAPSVRSFAQTHTPPTPSWGPNERTNADRLEGLLRRAPDGLSTAELVAATGLHRNLVKRELDKLAALRRVAERGKRGKAGLWFAARAEAAR